MADIHTDITNGNDSTGDGSAGTPYQTIQQAIDNANGGDTIWIGDSATNTLGSQLNWTSFGGVQDTSTDNRLVVRGWDYSGGAGADGLAVISGGGTIASPQAAWKNYITWYHLHFDDYTSNGLILGNGNDVYECKVSNIDAGYAINHGATNYSRVINCLVDTVAGGIRPSASGGQIYGCVIKDHSAYGIFACPASPVINNITISNGGHGIYVSDHVVVFQNTIIGDGSTSSIAGVYIPGTSENCSVFGNLIKGWSGSSNSGIENVASGNALGVIGFNHFDDNTANMTNVSGDMCVDLTSSDSSGSVTFTSPGTDDYSIDVSNTGYDPIFYGTATQRYMDTGAAQRATGGASGGILNPGVTGGMALKLQAGTTNQIVPIFVGDTSSSDGSGLTGLVYNSAGLTAYYHREDDGDAGGTAISLATATRGTWATGGFVEKDATNMPGVYELHLPNAVLASGSKWAVVQLKGAQNMAPVMLEIELTSVDIHDVGLGIVLDKLLYNSSTYASDVTADSVLDQLANTSANGGTFNRESRSLDAIATGGASIDDIADGQHNVLVATTITVTDQTHFTLAAGSSDDDAYNDMLAVFEDASTSTQKAVATISDYVGSSKTVTLAAAPAFTIATSDKVRILATRTGASVASIADGVWDEDIVAAHITSDTAGSILSTDRYWVKFEFIGGSTTDKYRTVQWMKNDARVTTTVTSPTIQVISGEDGTDLIGSTALTQAGASSLYKYDATGSELTTSGVAYAARFTATIDGASRTFQENFTRS